MSVPGKNRLPRTVSYSRSEANPYATGGRIGAFCNFVRCRDVGGGVGRGNGKVRGARSTITGGHIGESSRFLGEYRVLDTGVSAVGLGRLCCPPATAYTDDQAPPDAAVTCGRQKADIRIT